MRIQWKDDNRRLTKELIKFGVLSNDSPSIEVDMIYDKSTEESLINWFNAGAEMYKNPYTAYKKCLEIRHESGHTVCLEGAFIKQMSISPADGKISVEFCGDILESKVLSPIEILAERFKVKEDDNT